MGATDRDRVSRWRASGSRQAIAAAVHLSGNRDDELDEGVNLLADIRGVFGSEPERESLSTYELLDALLAFEESPWRGWWSDPRSDDLKPSKAAPRKLARTLKPFGIRRADVWMPGGTSRKGYRLDDFRDAWARYLPSTGEREGREGREPAPDAGSRLAHTNPERARDAEHEREGRGDLAQTEGSRPPRPSHPSGESEHVQGWFVVPPAVVPPSREDGTGWLPCARHPGPHKIVSRNAGLVYLACGCSLIEERE